MIVWLMKTLQSGLRRNACWARQLDDVSVRSGAVDQGRSHGLPDENSAIDFRPCFERFSETGDSVAVRLTAELPAKWRMVRNITSDIHQYIIRSPYRQKHHQHNSGNLTSRDTGYLHPKLFSSTLIT
jgi:hypothetical protein